MYNFDRLISEGISPEHSAQLRRISMTLSRWHELECGDGNEHGSWCITRGNKTGKVFEYADDGKPYMEYHSNTANGPTYRRVPDRERGALKRLKAIMSNYPALTAYVQGDPRGCALYVGKGLTDTTYSQGIAIYK